MANPDPSQSCPQGSTSDETGLAWDMVSQAGALLRSTSASNPLARLHVQHEYLTGYSQTGGYMATYINDFAQHFVQANGLPIFDGYLIGRGTGSPSWRRSTSARRLRCPARPRIRSLRACRSSSCTHREAHR